MLPPKYQVPLTPRAMAPTLKWARSARAQAAAMIGRTQAKGYALADLTFTDSAQIPTYAAYYIRAMVGQGVINGYSDGSFKPHSNITRGQMAKILYNLM